MRTSKKGIPLYRRICGPCHFAKHGINGWEYKNHRKDYCENARGKHKGWLIVPCCITEFPKKYLTVDHLDGDHENNDPDNLMTLCHTCHAVKTHIFGDSMKQGTRVKYVSPNFAFEWGEAQRYPELKALGQSGWMRLANTGSVMKYNTIKEHLSNTEANADNVENAFKTLTSDRRRRFQTAFEKKVIELPIAIKFSDTNYDLVAGNTRLTGLVCNGIDPKLWVIDISSNLTMVA